MNITKEEKLFLINKRLKEIDLLINQYAGLINDNPDYPQEKLIGYQKNIESLNLSKKALQNIIVDGII